MLRTFSLAVFARPSIISFLIAFAAFVPFRVSAEIVMAELSLEDVLLCANAENVHCQIEAAHRFVKGVGGARQDYNKSLSYAQRAAAQSGDSRAHTILAAQYDAGWGVTQNSSTAAKQYELAARAGGMPAAYMLAKMYETGRGVPLNVALAAEWAKRAAEGGNDQALFLMGNYYARGTGVDVDYEMSAFWFKKAADAGNTEAQARLGYMYSTGSGVRRDLKASLSWLLKAAERGNGEAYSRIAGAEYSLAKQYLDAADTSSALELFKKSAESGLPRAQSMLGDLYFSGRGVAKNYDAAAVWYSKAAALGDAHAQSRLGRMYVDGISVKHDIGLALSWLNKAAAAGDSEAISLIPTVEARRRK